jgi:hypothetical protein
MCFEFVRPSESVCALHQLCREGDLRALRRQLWEAALLADGHYTVVTIVWSAEVLDRTWFPRGEDEAQISNDCRDLFRFIAEYCRHRRARKYHLTRCHPSLSDSIAVPYQSLRLSSVLCTHGVALLACLLLRLTASCYHEG